MKEKKLSIFQITAIVLTILLVVFIVVSIGIIIDLKNKIDDTKDKNDDISQSAFCDENYAKIQEKYLKNIEIKLNI